MKQYFLDAMLRVVLPSLLGAFGAIMASAAPLYYQSMCQVVPL